MELKILLINKKDIKKTNKVLKKYFKEIDERDIEWLQDFTIKD